MVVAICLHTKKKYKLQSGTIRLYCIYHLERFKLCTWAQRIKELSIDWLSVAIFNLNVYDNNLRKIVVIYCLNAIMSYLKLYDMFLLCLVPVSQVNFLSNMLRNQGPNSRTLNKRLYFTHRFYRTLRNFEWVSSFNNIIQCISNKVRL